MRLLGCLVIPVQFRCQSVAAKPLAPLKPGGRLGEVELLWRFERHRQTSFTRHLCTAATMCRVYEYDISVRRTHVHAFKMVKVKVITHCVVVVDLINVGFTEVVPYTHIVLGESIFVF